MAIISLSGLINSIKGSVNGSTFQRSASGLILRNKPKSVGKGTNAQATVRNIQGQLNTAWRGLGDTNRLIWATFASFANGSNVTNKGNRSANTGKMQFIAVNFWLLQYGKSVLSLPTVGATETSFIPCPPDYTTTSNLMNYDGTLDTTEQILVTRVSLPQSNSTNTANTGMRTLVYTQVDGSQQNWASAYYATYGILPPYNYKYWIELQVVNFITGAISAPARRLVSYVPSTTALGLVVDTTQAGSASDTFVLPAFNTGTYNATVYWGDGSVSTISTWNDADLTHTYPVAGTYTVYIEGDFPRIYFNNSGDKMKLIDIVQFGSWQPSNLSNSFYGCANLVGTWSDSPDLSASTSMLNAFNGCSIMNGDFSAWDVSTITNMQDCFLSCTMLTGSHSTWDVSSLVNMTRVFSLCSLFDDDLSSWDVSSVTVATNFMLSTALTTAHLDAIYNAWSLLSVQSGVVISFTPTKYTIATSGAARAILTGAPNNWVITDGGGI
jgi:Mycoplasma protein of unknown function, DUF285